MFRSIRWRLVLSYTTLTLLTVILVGLLTLTLVQRYIERQEIDYLTANAQAVARQAQPFLQHTPMLDQLVHTAAFLGNVQVEISDARGRILADSGRAPLEHTLTWYVRRGSGMFHMPTAGRVLPGIILALPESHAIDIPSEEIQVQLNSEIDTEVTFSAITVERVPGVWGSRIAFEGMDIAAGTKPDRTLAAAGRREERPPLFWQPIAEETPSETADGLSSSSTRTVTVPIRNGEQILGYVALSNGIDFAAESLPTIRRALATAGLGVGLLAVFVGLFVGQGLTSPLAALGAAARRMSSGDLSARAPVSGTDEIGELAAQFNQMAERLQVSFDQLAAERDALRHFIADASHELRTPITALKTFVELLQGPAARDQEAQTEFLAESQIQLDRLTWITENLLDLSRLDAHLVQLDVDRHDAGDLIREVVASFRVVAQERGAALALQVPATPALVVCDRSRIELALSNLIDNALKYTPAGGAVTVGAAAEEQTVRLWVADTGPGISEQDLPHIFDRFYRGRNGTAHANGSGLGLAIAQSVAKAHDGRIEVESKPGHGSRFDLILPARSLSSRANGAPPAPASLASASSDGVGATDHQPVGRESRAR